MALYHKHRPQTFSSVIGQSHIIQTLTNQILSDKVSHAYLFSGPRGVGKTTTARLLAKALNCKKRAANSAEPCDTCDSCAEISASRAIDVIEIDAASNTGVENVRSNIIENAQFRPTNSAYKIFIIDEVHMLSTSAFNALLKIMEEPPAHVVFILATTELHKLPDTIISRCQRFTFARLSYNEMADHLNAIAKEEGVKIDKDVLDRVIAKSEGCARDGVSLLDQLMASGEKKITEAIASLVLPVSSLELHRDFVAACLEKNMSKGLDTLGSAAATDADFSTFATICIQLLRSLLIAKINSTDATVFVDVDESTKKQLQALAKNTQSKDIVSLIDLLFKRRQDIPLSPLPSLPLEMALVEWCDNNEPQQGESASAPHSGATPDIEAKKSEPIAPVQEFPTTDSFISLEEVQAKWNQFVTEMEQISPSMVFILKMATLVEVAGNTVKISVSYSFHKDKLADTKNRLVLEERLSNLLQKKISLSITVIEDTSKAIDESPEELQFLANALGGEVV